MKSKITKKKNNSLKELNQRRFQTTEETIREHKDRSIEKPNAKKFFERREKWFIIYRESIWLITDFSWETVEARK